MRAGTIRWTVAVLGAVAALAFAMAPERAFAAPPPPDDLRDATRAFEQARSQGNASGVRDAARAIASVGNRRAVDYLCEAAVEADEATFGACQDALASITASEGVEAIHRQGTRGRDGRVRVMLATVIGRIDHAQRIATLAAMLDDDARPVRVAAARALGGVRQREAVEPLIDYMAEREGEGGGQEVAEARGALEAITGSRFQTAEEWRTFWQTRRDTFDPARPGETITGQTRSRDPVFFGSEIASRRVVLVLDVSNSMRVIDGAEGQGGTSDPGVAWPPNERSRFARARDELIQFVENAPPEMRLNIICYADTVQTWQEGGRLIPASPAAKRAAIEWVRGIQWGPATRTDLGLDAGFAIGEADTVYLLSDGNPEMPGNVPISQDEICEHVREINRFRNVTVHCMGFPGQHRTFLERLARENHGTYRDVR